MRLRNAPNTEIRFNCIYHDDSGMPNAHGIELTAVSGSVVSGNRIGPLTGNGIDLYDWDGPTAPLAIENNEFDRVGTAVKTEGDAHEKAHISIRDNRIIESHWDAITIWSGWYGPLFIESNDIVRGPAEAIHVEGHPWHPYPEVHVNSNRIEDINWAAINLARGHFGFVHVGENIITGTGVGIQMEGQGNGVDQAHINGNTIVDVRGPAISLWPERYDFVHMGFNSIEQDVGMLPWDIGAIDVRLGEHPAGPILVVDNTIGLRGAGPPVFGVYVEGPASELYMAGNDLLAPGVPDATGLTIMTGAPWLPPIPEDTRFRLDCNEFVGFPWGIRVIGPDFLPGGFPPPPAEFVMEQNGFLDVGVAVDNGPPGASADIHAPWNYWGSDDPPPDFPNVAEHPYMLLHDYDFDGNGIRNCKDQDVDADGIPNVEDLCMFTVADELERDLGPNQWRLGGVPGAYAFETERRGSGGRLRSYTLADTRGCSCFDILRQLDARDYFWTTDPGTGDPVYEGYEGHLKKGCSPSVMDAWLVVADGGDPPPMDGPAAGKDGDPGMPASFALRTAYPNPFNPTTTLVYEVPEAARVRIAVHDVLGRVVRVLVDGTSPPGRHRVTFDAGILPSGVYLVRFEHPTGAATRTVQLLR